MYIRLEHLRSPYSTCDARGHHANPDLEGEACKIGLQRRNNSREIVR